MIAVFMREKHAIELFRRHAAECKPQHELTRAQSAIDQKPAMIGRDKCTVPGAAAAEHRQTEHV
jgi:hypothetical protein